MGYSYDNIHLSIMAIESAAAQLNISGSEMYQRLKAQGLVGNFLLPFYDELHSQSLEWLTNTTIKTLKNWEEAKK